MKKRFLMSLIFLTLMSTMYSQVIRGVLVANDYDENGILSQTRSRNSTIEVWSWNPGKDPAYTMEYTVKTIDNGLFLLPASIRQIPSVLLISQHGQRASALHKFSPEDVGANLDTPLYTDYYADASYILLDTFYRGKQYYKWDGDDFYFVNGTITRNDNFFFPNLTQRNRTVNNFLNTVFQDLPRIHTKDDEAIVQKIQAVFEFLRQHGKLSLGVNDRNINQADELLFQNCRGEGSRALVRWPTLEEYAQVYNRFGFIPLANCTAWTQFTASLLHAGGVHPDKLFIAKHNYDPSWLVEHWVIAMHIGSRWHSLDPYHRNFIQPKSIDDFNQAIWERYIPRQNDWQKPFEAYLTPGSTLTRVHFLGDRTPYMGHVLNLQDAHFFTKNSTFKYISSSMHAYVEGTAQVLSIENGEIRIMAEAEVERHGPEGVDLVTIQRDMLIHFKEGLYTYYIGDNNERVYEGRVSNDGQTLELYGSDDTISFIIVAP